MKTSTIIIGAGGVALAAGAYYWYTKRKESERFHALAALMKQRQSIPKLQLPSDMMQQASIQKSLQQKPAMTIQKLAGEPAMPDAFSGLGNIDFGGLQG